MSSSAINIFWFRRDLRLNDNHGLYQALKAGLPVLPVFIFDRNILDELEEKNDPRVSFIYQALENIQQQLTQYGTGLDVRFGYPLDIVKQLVKEYEVNAIYTNEDYEPYAIQRDASVKDYLSGRNTGFHAFKDQVIFEKNEVVKNDGSPYMIFTPFARKWHSMLQIASTKNYDAQGLFKNFHRYKKAAFPSIEEIGFTRTKLDMSADIGKDLIKNYDKTRDFPALNGTTRLGPHLRFGTISIRQLVKKAREWNSVFLNELVWREFFMQMLWRQPRLVHESCKPAYDKIHWRNNRREFDLWCQGKTGYPLVDAGMRELNETGFMHNRVRMVTASFLVKHLLIDWRWGEAWFAKKLMDYELASNNGNWQWVAGCGCDAAPYFRIFNPTAQTKRFDPKLEYIKKWIPELDSFSYPKPIVDHELAKSRCLKVYREALNAGNK